MRTTETVIVEQQVTRCTCDFCDTTTTNNRGCCGTAIIMRCSRCNKDCCDKHRWSFYDDTSDYPDYTTCIDCFPIVHAAWEIAQTVAKRYEGITEVVERTVEEIEKGEWNDEEQVKNPITLEKYIERRNQRQTIKREDLYEA